ncbi:MAG: DnaD domain protein [Dehalococcoidales bacterium]
MKAFSGFPAKMSFTPVPNAFINNLLPQIDDIGELKVTLHVIEALYAKKGFPQYVAFSELAANASLISNFKEREVPADGLKEALQKAVARQTILELETDKGALYLLNTEANRQAAGKIKSGVIKIKGIAAAETAAVNIPEDINVFGLYEENIGMLTPMVAEELKDIIKIFPEDWIADAIKEAVKQNARKLSYIVAILERWAKEGRSDGAYRRDIQKDDPQKYTGGKYGRYVQR